MVICNSLRSVFGPGAAITVAVFLVAGCGSSDLPELGGTYGWVKLDGEPLPRASVRFQPLEGGRPALAMTDEDGYYELKYVGETHGAVLGKHVVRISTGIEGYDEGEGGDVQPTVPERVPVQYNRDALDNPEMQVEIKSGTNEINFDLSSEGEIVQPDGPNPEE